MPESRGGWHLRARTRLSAIAALGLVVAAAAALILGGEVAGSRAGAKATTKGSGSATIARRDLIETDTESGTLSYADSRTVFNRVSGIITSLPAAGTVVKPGGVLFTVDNSPVVLMDGALPAYRTLADGVADGPDVRELEQNLVGLGDDPTHAMTVDDHFDAATTAAVERWQGATGQTQTGTVTLGQVVFLPGARRISAVSAALGSTGSSSAGSAGSATGASLRLPAAGHAEFVDLTTTTTSSTTLQTTTTTRTSTARMPSPAPRSRQGASTPTLLALIALLRAEVAELRAARGSAGGASTGGRSTTTGASKTGASGAAGAASGARSVGASGAAGAASGGSAAGGASSAAGAPAAQAVLTTTSNQLVATVPLDATKQSEAVLGAPVTVQMPDGSTVDGRIAQVAAAAQTTSSSSTSNGSGSGSGAAAGSSGSGATSTVPVTIALRGHLRSAGLDQAAVSVDFEQQKALGVLSVPVTALLATAGGGYAIQPVDQPRHLIPVTPGLFAAGYVQISGSGIVPGLAVTDSQG